eukprot:COSAG01_NODE_33982_length_555_cov_1.333333_1_plen_145_part_01
MVTVNIDAADILAVDSYLSFSQNRVISEYYALWDSSVIQSCTPTPQPTAVHVAVARTIYIKNILMRIYAFAHIALLRNLRGIYVQSYCVPGVCASSRARGHFALLALALVLGCCTLSLALALALGRSALRVHMHLADSAWQLLQR